MRRSPKARCLDGGDLEAAAQLVDDERGKSLALDVLGDDEERLARLDDGFQQRHHRLQRRELLLVQQDDRVLEFDGHLLGVGDEIGREVAAVELHALDDIGLGLEALVLLDGDDTLVADLLHRVGDLAADLGFAVGRDGADLRHFGAVVDRARGGLDLFDDLGHGHVDAALEVHRVHAGGDRLHAAPDDGGGEDGGGGGAVTGLVVGAVGHFLDHLRAHVLELVLELDLLGDGDAVLGDAGRAEALVDDDVAALGAERDLHRIGEDVDTLEHAIARIGIEFDVLGSHFHVLLRLVSGGKRDRAKARLRR